MTLNKTFVYKQIVLVQALKRNNKCLSPDYQLKQLYGIVSVIDNDSRNIGCTLVYIITIVVLLQSLRHNSICKLYLRCNGKKAPTFPINVSF